MRVLLSTHGSRGDVEPIAALAVQLRTLGVEVRVCAPPDQEFVELLARVGVPLVPAFSPVRTWVKDVLKRAAAADPQQAARIVTTQAAEVFAAQIEAIAPAAEGCDVLLAAGLFPSTAAAQAVAERRGIHYIYATFCPLWLPSTHHQPHAFRGHPHPAGVTDNRALWDLNVQTMNTLFGEALNAGRASMGLPLLDNVRDHVFTDRPWLASDPVLSPWMATELRNVVQSGAWMLSDERPLPADLLAFLEAGAAPVYVGFGSMPMHASKDAAPVAIGAIRALGLRAVVLRGWAELERVDDGDDCFVVGEVNQQALFRRMAAVVHHGGAGTTSAATRAGVPQVIVPQIGDQPYWACRVAELGIGAAHDGSLFTFESLSTALRTVLSPEVQERALEVAATVRTDGAAEAANSILDTLKQQRRCASA